MNQLLARFDSRRSILDPSGPTFLQNDCRFGLRRGSVDLRYYFFSCSDGGDRNGSTVRGRGERENDDRVGSQNQRQALRRSRTQTKLLLRLQPKAIREREACWDLLSNTAIND